MKRISTSTKVTDKFGSGKHGFTDGDVGAGTPATDLEGDLFDHLQEELCNVMEAAGITVDGSTRTMLLSALRAAGVFQTASQFDATTKAATTAFVQGALGNLRGVAAVSSNTTFDGTHMGKLVRNNGANTHTLPLSSSVSAGSRITVTNQDGGVACTIQRSGSENIERNGSGATSVSLKFGETLTFVATGTSWVIIDGLGTSSLASSGYQRMPSGLIVQWGTVAAAANPNTFTLPIAFPTAALRAFATFQDNSAARFATAFAASTTQVNTTGWASGGSVVTSGESIQVLAIGY